MKRGAGGLDHRITVQRASTTTNSFNEPVESWSDVGEVWASKEDISDGEKWRAGAVGADVSTRFVARFNAVTSDIKKSDRIIAEGRTYNVFSTKEMDRRKLIEITAAAVSNEPES